jgi:hypothetical protein
MSMAISHFAFWAAMTTLLITVLVPNIRYPRTLLLAGGGWAMVPDLHWVSPVFTEQLRAIHQTSPWMDLFWFHRTLDRVDPGDSTAVAAVLIGLLIVATAVAEYRSYRTPDVVKSAYESLPKRRSSK